MSEADIKKAIEKAVSDEDYELAARLKSQLNETAPPPKVAPPPKKSEKPLPKKAEKPLPKKRSEKGHSEEGSAKGPRRGGPRASPRASPRREGGSR